MKRNSLTILLAAAGMLLAGVQTAKAQKVVLHMKGNQTFECSISQLDSITFVGEDLIIEEEHEWVDLGLPSGTLWATCNVGASCPEEYGDYFAWGETKPKTNYSSSSYSFTDNPSELLSEDDAATANWGNGWLMPSKEQMDELISSENTTTIWTQQNGVNGRLITSKKNSKTLFLPAAGFYSDTTLNYAGSYGDYWLRSAYNANSDRANDLFFQLGTIYTRENVGVRSGGQSVRPVRVKTR